MKWFNLTFVAIWLTIFGTSTVPTNEVMSDWHDAVVYEVNNAFADYVWISPSNNKGEAIALNDSAATQFYLRHTFTTLLFFLFGINVAFYAGNGAIGRRFGDGAYMIHWFREEIWGKQIKSRYLERQARRRSRQREEEDTNKYHERLAGQRGLS